MPRTKTATKGTRRTAVVQVAARLTTEEKERLDMLVSMRDATERARGASGGGFNGWLRARVSEQWAHVSSLPPPSVSLPGDRHE